MFVFRPIRPLPTPSSRGGDQEQAPKKKRAIVAQCDGARPKCQNCQNKGWECAYDGEEGQSRASAMKSRIEFLERRVDELQTNQLDQGQSSDLIPLSLPTIPFTQRALDGFFSCSGKLFHFFSRPQVSAFFDSVFQDEGELNSDKKADICCLMAVAAAGYQYTENKGGQESDERFYSLAKHYLDDIIETRPLDAIKVCSLLGMYNIFKKNTTALAYVDIGLGMCLRFGLDCERRQLSSLTDGMWLDYRRAWRTLTFFSTWLSVTLGYRFGNGEALKRMSPSQFDVGDPSDISEVVQNEMTKISMLKAHILQMHLAFKRLTPLSIKSIMKDLQNWYDKMPDAMHLDRLGREGLPVEAKRSICHTHLLYLGAHMLLFRRIACELVRASAARNDQNRNPLGLLSESLLAEQGEGALLAAKSSSTIIKLLYEENSVFKRCWLVIFQTYTSCVIILHAVSQKQARGEDSAEWEDGAQHIRSCLAVLRFCASADPVAAKFHARLSDICKSLSIYDPNPTAASTSSPEHGRGASSSAAAGAPTTADQSSPARAQDSPSEVSFGLLELLCRPFGDLSYREFTMDSLASEQRSDPTRYEHPHLVERLDWDYENKALIEWDTQNLGITSSSGAAAGADDLTGNVDMTLPGPYDLRQQHPGNRFLDSARPSGWAALGEVTRPANFGED
ncbi:hypothetical protein GGR53DRAFT_471995 [Hypoxylon sp. FL1150]|nr:hypothetical protein GGR53DRAFT_471995 [Hypoxylon sp. FL1150]